MKTLPSSNFVGEWQISIVSRFSLQVVSWCGTRESGTVLDVTGSVVVVSFTTDSSATGSGFDISMEFVNSSKWDSFQQMFMQYIIIKLISSTRNVKLMYSMHYFFCGGFTKKKHCSKIATRCQHW